MDQHMRLPRCPNCGTEWAPEGALVTGGEQNSWGYPCPVCLFHVTFPAMGQELVPLSVGELQGRLTALLTEARLSGVMSDEIVAVLRDELEFEAELGAPGRRMLVQIIDLGQLDPEMQPMRPSGSRKLQHSRSLAQ